MDARFAVPGVGPDTPAAQAAIAILLARLEPLLELEHDAAAGADPDAVHDMRVASRRMREAMRLFESLYPPKPYRRWYRRVRDITRALGPVRDADVFGEQIHAALPSLEEGGRRAAAFAVGWRLAERELDLTRLRDSLERIGIGDRRVDFMRFVLAPQERPEAVEPLQEFAADEIAPRLEEAWGYMPRAVRDRRNVEAQHLMRIAVKRLRYAVEVFAPVYGDEFEGVWRLLRRFQDVLGDLHDADALSVRTRSRSVERAATLGGVSADDLNELASYFESRAQRLFIDFSRLASVYPAHRMQVLVLGPLGVELPARAQQLAALWPDHDAHVPGHETLEPQLAVTTPGEPEAAAAEEAEPADDAEPATGPSNNGERRAPSDEADSERAQAEGVLRAWEAKEGADHHVEPLGYEGSEVVWGDADE